MSQHIRNSIIGGLKTLLEAAPVHWEKVFNQRIVMRRVLETYLLIYFIHEDSERLTIHPSSPYRCTVQFKVDAVFRVADSEDLETAIGDTAAEIQGKLTNEAALAAGLAIQDMSLIATDVSVEEDQKTSVIMEQTWVFTYMMTEGSATI